MQEGYLLPEGLNLGHQLGSLVGQFPSKGISLFPETVAVVLCCFQENRYLLQSLLGFRLPVTPTDVLFFLRLSVPVEQQSANANEDRRTGTDKSNEQAFIHDQVTPALLVLGRSRLP